MTLIIDLLRSLKVKFDGAIRKLAGPTGNCSEGPTSYLSPFLRYFK